MSVESERRLLRGNRPPQWDAVNAFYAVKEKYRPETKFYPIGGGQYITAGELGIPTTEQSAALEKEEAQLLRMTTAGASHGFMRLQLQEFFIRELNPLGYVRL